MGPFPLACKLLRCSDCTASGRVHLRLYRQDVRRKKKNGNSWEVQWFIYNAYILYLTHWQTFLLSMHSLICTCLPLCFQNYITIFHLYFVHFLKKKKRKKIWLVVKMNWIIFEIKHCIVMSGKTLVATWWFLWLKVSRNAYLTSQLWEVKVCK